MKKRINIRKAITITCVIDIFIIICLLVTALLLMNTGGNGLEQGRLLLVVLAVLALLCSAASILFAWSLIERDAELKQVKSSVEEMNQLNNTLRAQHHDYLNHLQVVYGLMELEQYDDANDYIERVYDDIQKVSGILKTGIPAVNAILQAKQQMCQSRGIEVKIDVRSRLDAISVPDWELCRVLGNIIDNAINAMTEMTGDKRLEIALFEDIKNYGFTISNNGPAIPQSLFSRIFEAGYSSGSHKGDGMGLAICEKIFTKYGGELTVKSDENSTAFTGLVPRQTA